MRMVIVSVAAALLIGAPAASQRADPANAKLAARPAPQTVAPPRWNPRAPENSQILPNFSYATVEPVLDAIGARYQRGAQTNRPTIRVTLPNNRRAVLVFGSCNAAGACKALGIQSTWEKPSAAPERTAQAVAAFNQRYSFAKALVLPDGRPALQRYVTADYGFIRGNLAVNLLVFANQAQRFTAEAVAPLAAAR
jgi:hypothetical protein